MCNPIDFILFGSEIYCDLYYNIIETLFDRLEYFQFYPLRAIDHQDDIR